ncbi:hypothetical protein M1D46_13985 [Microbacterium sp. JZ70]
MSELAATSTWRCFVVGPIGNKFAPIGDPAREIYEDALEVFEKVIQPACQAVSIEPVRADQIALTGEINEQVFRHLYEDEVVIADVSGGNPNVMYELGLRHTRPLLTIQLGEFGQLPFDITAVRTIQFSRSDRGLIDARKQLQRALEFGMNEPGEGVTATRIWNSASESPIVLAQDPALLAEPADAAGALDEEDVDADGFIDRIANLEESMPTLTNTTTEIGAVVSAMGRIAADSNEEIALLNASSAPMNQRLTAVANFARALQPSADELETLTSNFYENMKRLDVEVRGILGFLERNPSMLENASIRTFLETITAMTRSSRQAMENVNQFGSAIETLSGLSKVLRRPARQVSESVRTMLRGIQLTDHWEEVALRLKQVSAV